MQGDYKWDLHDSDYDDFSDFEHPQRLTKMLIAYFSEVDGFFDTKNHELEYSIRPFFANAVHMWVSKLVDSSKVETIRQQLLGIKLKQCGSSFFGQARKGEDIDLLLIVPQFISLNDFFGSFFDLLAELGVLSLRAIKNATVPIIKCRVGSFEVDIMISRLPFDNPNFVDLYQNDFIHHMDISSILALNAHRNTIFIRESVTCTNTFIRVLQVIKFWVKNKGLYSNLFGLFGGITLAIMVAKICQDFNLGTVDTIMKFFEIYGQWNWQTHVELTDSHSENHGFQPPVPSSATTRISTIRNMHMPVKTPVYPQQLTTQDLTRSARRLFDKRVSEANETFQTFASSFHPWRLILDPFNFFKNYNEFICVTLASSPNQNLDDIIPFFETKLRHLIGIMDEEECLYLSHINTTRHTPLPWSKIESNQLECPRFNVWFIGLEFEQSFTKNDLNVQRILNKFNDLIKRRSLPRRGTQANEKQFEELNIVNLEYCSKDDLYKFIHSDIIRGQRPQ